MDQARRMYANALARIHDAGILARSTETRSDSASLLEILGLEILLKCAVLISGSMPKRSHLYVSLWQQLPTSAQKQIMAVARARMPGHADLSDVEKLLRAFQSVFEKGRYFYELYEGWTLEQEREYAALWESIGAPTDEADMQYYPNERTCLIDGLKSYIDQAAP